MPRNTIERRPFRLAFLTTLALSAACSTLSVHKPSVKEVKRASIVGYTVDLSSFYQTVDPPGKSRGVMGAINAINKTRKLADGRHDIEKTKQATEIYSQIAEQLRERMGWDVLRYDDTSKNDAYRSVVLEHERSWAGDREWDKRYLSGIMWDGGARRLSPDDRAALFDGLGVDAIAVCKVRYRVGDTSGMGGLFGSKTYHPEALIELIVYDAKSAEPIWHDKLAEGLPTADGLNEQNGFESTADMTPVFIEALGSALDRLIKRYEEFAEES